MTLLIQTNLYQNPTNVIPDRADAAIHACSDFVDGFTEKKPLTDDRALRVTVIGVKVGGNLDFHMPSGLGFKPFLVIQAGPDVGRLAPRHTAAVDEERALVAEQLAPGLSYSPGGGDVVTAICEAGEYVRFYPPLQGVALTRTLLFDLHSATMPHAALHHNRTGR